MNVNKSIFSYISLDLNAWYFLFVILQLYKSVYLHSMFWFYINIEMLYIYYKSMRRVVDMLVDILWNLL